MNTQIIYARADLSRGTSLRPASSGFLRPLKLTFWPCYLFITTLIGKQFCQTQPRCSARQRKRQPLAWAYLSSAAAINQHPPSISKSFPLPLRPPSASGASHAHHQKFSATLRTETGKPVPFLYFCSSFSTHSNSFPLGVSPPPKVSFSKALVLSTKLTHPCLALTLVSLYLPGELTSYTAQ